MGLTQIPRAIMKKCKLKRIQFDFNSHFRFLPNDGVPVEFSGVKNLSFRTCRMPSLPDNINNLKRITSLNLEENLLELLPSSFTKLRTLTFLGELTR